MSEDAPVPAWALRLRERRQKLLLVPKQFVSRMREIAGPGAGLASTASLLRALRAWESGTSKPRPVMQVLIAAVLDTTVEELFCDDPVSIGGSWTTDSVSSPNAARRQTAAAAGPPPALAPLNIGGVADAAHPRGDTVFLSAAPADVRIEQGDVMAMRAMLTTLTISDRQFGGQHTLQHAADYFQTMIAPRLRSPAPDSDRRALQSLATEFLLRVAALHLDAGQARTAHTYLGKALTLTHEAEDVTLMAWVLSRMGEYEIHQALLARHHGNLDEWARRVGQAMGYTSGAAAMVERSAPSAKAFLLSKHALAVAMSGDRGATMRILRQVRLSAEQAGSTPEPPWMGSYGWEHVRHEEARCFYTLGLGDEAVRAVQDSLPARTGTRPRAFSLGVQALGHLQTSDLSVDQACTLTQELISCIRRVRSDRLVLRLGEIMRALKPHARVATVKELQETARPLLAFPVPPPGESA